MTDDIDPGRQQALRAIFEKTDDTGARVYSDDDVFHFVPWVLLADGAVDAATLSDEVATMLGGFLTLLGLGLDATPKQVGDTLRAYYEDHPVNAQLVADFLKFAGAGSQADAASMSSAKKLLGAGSDVIPVGAREGGGERASPLSRFTLKTPDEQKDG